jgi:DNA-binding CsgD family transcriptional regulator/tetratricopeptide (TPR) repeat protein
MSIIAPMARVSSPVFVGRTAELERIWRALERARSARPTTCLVGGDAGIGKTRLIGEFVAGARSSGAHILIGDCLQLGETGLPYAPFVGALRPLLRSLPRERLNELIGPGRGELSHLLPDLGSPVSPSRGRDGTPSATAEQARLFEIVFGMLRRLADDEPVVLILEDLHWADSSTRDLLRFLVRNARDARFLFIGTYRSDELHRRHPLRPLLAELQRLEAVDDIELGAFGADELAQQLAGITGEFPHPELVSAVLTRSGGNPFFVEELMAVGEAGLALTRSLRDMLDDRVRHLEAEAQRVLRIASVAGARVDHGILAEVADLPEPILTEALRAAVEHHLLVPTAPEEVPGYRFRHALVQEVVYEELLPNERTQIHAAYAIALERRAQGDPQERAGIAAQLAHHWLMAHDLERALPATLGAARAAAEAFAYPEAQAFLERGLEMWAKVAPDRLPTGMDRTSILEEAAEAAAQAGDPRRSIDLVRSALAETDALRDPMRAGSLHHRLAWYLNESGDWQSGVTAMERAVDLIPIDPPTKERARVVADLAHSLMVRGRFSESMALAEAALAISRAVGAGLAETRALTALGLDLACRSDLERGIPVLRDGYLLAVELGDPQAIFLTSVGLGWALDETARHEEAYEVARAARDRLREMGAHARFGGQLSSKMGRALYDLGRWEDAARVLDESIASEPTRYAMRWLLSNRIQLAIGRGQLSNARRDLLTYEALGERVVGPDPDLMGVRRAELALVTGEPTVARRIVAEMLERLIEPTLDTDARRLMMIGLRAEVEEAEAARGSDDRDREAAAIARADELAEQLERHVARVREVATRPAAPIEADLRLAKALASRARGKADVNAWEAAAAARRLLGRPFELARTLAGLAAVSFGARRREDGASALAEAHVIAVELGARPLREAIEALARRARIGLEGVDTADDAADRLGLTPREREVLALLADGRSNKQIGDKLFMAESTAGVHVSNILGKLGVTRRSEAAALAHRLGLFQVI